MIKFEVYTKKGELVDGFQMNPFAALFAIIDYRRKGYVVVIVWNVEDLN